MGGVALSTINTTICCGQADTCRSFDSTLWYVAASTLNHIHEPIISLAAGPVSCVNPIT